MEPLFVDRLLLIADLFQRDMARAFDGTGLTTARVHLLWVCLLYTSDAADE